MQQANPQSRSSKPGWLIILRRFLLVLVLLAVVAGICWYYGVPAALSGRDTNLEKAVDYMRSELQRMQVAAASEKNEVIKQFFEIYSQGWWHYNNKVSPYHPDNFFLIHLPKPVPSLPKSVLGDLWTRRHRDYVSARCEELWRCAGDMDTASSKVSGDLTELIKQCQENCQFHHWWKKQGPVFLRVLKMSPSGLDSEQVPVFYKAFCSLKSPQPWEESAAHWLRKELEKWQVRGLTEQDCQYRPYLIFACYFHFLSQKHFRKEDLKIDCYAASFVRKLPEEPLSVDGMFQSEEELRKQLLGLAARIISKPDDRPNAGATISSILSAIREALDYDSYLEQVKRLLIVEEEDKTPGQLKEFVERFKKH